jgi:hypothetical protein
MATQRRERDQQWPHARPLPAQEPSSFEANGEEVSGVWYDPRPRAPAEEDDYGEDDYSRSDYGSRRYNHERLNPEPARRRVG